MIGIYRYFIPEQPSIVLYSAKMQAKASFSTVAELRCVCLQKQLVYRACPPPIESPYATSC